MKVGTRFTYRTADARTLNCTVSAVQKNENIWFYSTEGVLGYFSPEELADLQEFITLVTE